MHISKKNKAIFLTVIGSVCILALAAVSLMLIPRAPTPTGTSSSESVISQQSEVSSAVQSQPEVIEKKLTVTSPANQDVTVKESSIVFAGSCDPNKELYINDTLISVNSEGVFSTDVALKVGKNTFTIKCGEEELTYIVRYKYILVESYSPNSAKTFESGSTMVVRVVARFGSNVTAVFQNETITLTQEYYDPVTPKPEFVGYFGSFKLPTGTERDTSLGKVKFTTVMNGITESHSSGTITLKKNPIIQNDGSADTPTGGNYINVGSGYIAEVVQTSIETFDGKTVDDYSRPTNSYLPLGTVDYCSTGTIVDPSSDMEYRTLRYGKRVYTKNGMGDNIKTYIGTLPSTNSVHLADFNEDTRFTTLAFTVDWKAPFTLTMQPQDYYNEKYQDYRISDETFKYIDITFCYANEFSADFEFDIDNPVFSNYTIIKNESDYTLRLFLNKTGGFYGWDAYYNDNDELVFEFLKPVQITDDDTNDYGVNLEGATIYIDVGHGGSDPGAVSANNKHYESNLNLNLALKVKAQLELTGATVIINRTDDAYVSAYERMEQVRELKPDLVLSIHRNSNNSSKISGFNTYYFYPFSKAANDAVYNETFEAGLYTPTQYSGVEWHYFFLGRVSNCPVILSENGYMSNSAELEKIVSDAFNDECAVAMTKGIVEYFKSIQ